MWIESDCGDLINLDHVSKIELVRGRIYVCFAGPEEQARILQEFADSEYDTAKYCFELIKEKILKRDEEKWINKLERSKKVLKKTPKKKVKSSNT